MPTSYEIPLGTPRKSINYLGTVIALKTAETFEMKYPGPKTSSC